ncbi:MAG: ABC transporter ATP-binding protein [Eubacteriales bacterium]|uniref:ABC transporter ATP-binding protein n=2 Tax=Fenollaria TaxID=1686313 RepID=UPI002A7523DD|nr:ABC transporter ATP-binding protein [Fenollaria sp.]MDD7339991.1 ABC transporter ATP-binding protein [Eubacteriales bacterium]MDY3105457.1 ABC transporter ATP-binding protein [Fenollaria sp.]
MKYTKTLRRLLGDAIRADRKMILYILFACILGAFAPLVLSLMPKLIVGVVENPGTDAIRRILLISLGFFVLEFLVEGVSLYCSNQVIVVANKTRFELMNEQNKKMASVDYKYISDRSIFKMYGMAFEATSGDWGGVTGMLREFARTAPIILSLIIIGGVITALSPLTGLLLLLYAITYAYAQRQANKEVRDNDAEINKISDEIRYYNKTAGDFKSGKEIRLFNLKDMILNAYKNVIDKRKSFSLRAVNKTFRKSLLSVLILIIAQGIFAYTLILSFKNGSVDTGSFLMYLTLMLQFVLLADRAIEDYEFFVVNQTIYVENMYDLLETDKLSSDHGTRDRLSGAVDIEFRNVTFAYPNTDKKVLDNLSFKIAKNETIALVGNNGEGKSTIINLLVRLFRPDEGEILLNGININEFKEEELYKMFACIFQQVNIYPYTLGNNISMHETYDLERAKRAIEDVGLKERIEEEKNAYERNMSHEVAKDALELSGGQEQKLAISRAVYKDSPILILDEPTANLDALAEHEIYSKLNDLREDRTSIYISHRLSSTKFCDRIILLKGGKIFEEGTHDELMKKKGEYYEMFTIQGKYYTKEA